MTGLPDREVWARVEEMREAIIDSAHEQAIEKVAYSLRVDPDSVGEAFDRHEAESQALAEGYREKMSAPFHGEAPDA